jgi:hypothetical protein
MDVGFFRRQPAGHDGFVRINETRLLLPWAVAKAALHVLRGEHMQ